MRTELSDRKATLLDNVFKNQAGFCRLKRAAAGIMAFAGLVATANIASAEDDLHSFQLDNGVIELEYTRVSTGAAIGNYFYTPQGATVLLTTVTTTVGYGQDGLGFEVLVYNDPDSDGNPANAVLVSRQEAVIQPGRVSENWRNAFLQTVNLPETEVSGGFFVVVHLFEQPFNGVSTNGSWSTAPSAYLQHGIPLGNSWSVGALPGEMSGLRPLDFDNLGNNFLTRSGGPGFVGNWIIRAEGVAGRGLTDDDEDPARCIPDYNSDGGVDGADVESFFLDWQAGEPAADVNSDGGVDGRDVETFLLLWSQGEC